MGEAFNNLYRAIALLNGGKFRGQSEAEMILWDQCTRLVASIILYYNAYILNHLYLNAKSQAEKDLILALSPGAWIHINMLGYYQFCGLDSSRFVDDWLTKWDWQQALKVVEKVKVKISNNQVVMIFVQIFSSTIFLLKSRQ